MKAVNSGVLSHRFLAQALCAALACAWAAGCASSASSKKSASPPPDSPAAVAAAPSNVVAGNAAAFAHFAAGVSYELSDRDEKALQEFDSAAAADPAHEALVLELSQRYLRNHQPEKAVTLLARSAQRPAPSSPVFGWLARAYLQTGNTNESLIAGRKAVEKDPQSIDAYESLLEGAMRAGQFAEAARMLGRAAQAVPREPRTLTAVADLYTAYLRAVPKDKEARARAVELLDSVSAMTFTSTRLWQRSAELYNRLGESKKAARIYERLLAEAADAAPEKQTFREQLAQIYLESDDKTNALRQLQAIVRDDPTRYPSGLVRPR